MSFSGAEAVDRTTRECLASIYHTSLNGSTEHVQKALTTMRSKNPNAHAAIMVDCSHGNSSKNHLNQPKVAADVAEQIAKGETGIVGIM